MISKFFKYYFPVVMWLLLITILPFIVKGNVNSPIANVDKVVHFIEFSVLTFLMARAFFYGSVNREAFRSVLLAGGITIFIAAFDEFYQIYIPDRTASFSDLLADLLGVVVALIIFLVMARRAGQAV